MPQDTCCRAEPAVITTRLLRLREVIKLQADSDWGRSYVQEILAEDPDSPHAGCPRYAGILEESGEGSVILAETVQQLASEMGSLADAEIPILAVELIDLDTGERRLAHRHTTVGFIQGTVATENSDDLLATQPVR
jgi:hypothetical protein